MRHIVLLIILTSASFLQADEFDNIIINEFIALSNPIYLSMRVCCNKGDYDL